MQIYADIRFQRITYRWKATKTSFPINYILGFGCLQWAGTAERVACTDGQQVKAVARVAPLAVEGG